MTTDPIIRLYRGLPGSGKTRQACYWAVPFSGICICTDDYFMVGQSYKFDPTLISQAHAHTFRRYLDLLPQVIGTTRLAVHNTNIRAYELAPYMQAAAAYNHPIEIVTILCDPLVAYKRCVHEVPLEVIFRMHQGLMSEQLPTFWKHTIIPATE